MKEKHLETLIVALGIALASTGAAYADSDGSGAGGSGGDGGDNGMSRWRGESYAYFDRGARSADKLEPTIRLEPSVQKQPLRGDFYTSPADLAASPRTWGVGHAFRDDTAA